jgi:hypothetical protein
MLEGSVNEITVVYRDIATNKDAAVTYQNLASVQAQGVSSAVARTIPACGTLRSRAGLRRAKWRQ